MLKHQKSKLPELVNDFTRYLEEKGYALSTRRHLLAYYKQLLKFAEKHNVQDYSLEIGKAFLSEKHGLEWTTGKLSPHQNFLQRLVNMLTEFQSYGEVVSKRRLKRTYSIPNFEVIISEYIEHERSRGLRESTLTGKLHCLNQIFEYWESVGLKHAKDITPSAVYDFLESRTYFSLATKERYQYIFRDVIKYLHKKKLCNPGLLKLFTVISVHTKNSYPSYFSPEDISQVLNLVDTNTTSGKRDYLILLLATQLGIRAGDICALKIENVNFTKRLIEYVQLKTGDLVSFPMSKELFYAFIDYLKNARTESNFKEVFIKDRAPIEPFASSNKFHYILKKYLTAAEVNIIDGQKHGLHSMRSSLASNMLRDGVSILVISNILGHQYSDTTSLYLKIDIVGLRKAALEVPYDCN